MNHFLQQAVSLLAGLVLLVSSTVSSLPEKFHDFTSKFAYKPSVTAQQTKKTAQNQKSFPSVLAATIDRSKTGVTFTIPAFFKDLVTLGSSLEVNGPSTFNDKVTLVNQDLDLGTGELTASNVLYGLTAGKGILISEGQTPEIKLDLDVVSSISGRTGDVSLEEGSGISIDGLEIANSDKGSSQNIFKTFSVSGQSDIVASSNADKLTFVAGDGTVLTTDATAKTLTITSNFNNSGWVDEGTIVRLSGLTDSVGVGTNAPTNKLSVVGSADITGNLGIGTSSPSYKLDVAGNINLSSGSTFKIAGTDVLSSTSLGVGVTASNLTSLGTLGNLTVTGNSALNGGITFDNSTDTISAFTAGGTINMANNVITNIGNAGTDFTSSGGLTLAGLLTASSGVSLDAETVTDFSGNGIVVTSNSLFVNLTTSSNTGATSSNSGLEVGTGGLTLLKGCSDGELLKYTDAGGWACSTDIDTTAGNASGFIDYGTIVALITSADNLGVGTSSPTNKLSVVGNTDISGNLGVGTTTPAFKLDVAGSANLSSGSTYKINGTDVLSGSALGVGVTSSSLTQLGTLGNLTVTGTIVGNGGLTLAAGQALNVNSDAITDLTGNGIVLSGGTLTVGLTSSGTTGSSSSNSGLEVGSAGLTLLKGCADNELLKYTDASGWACAIDIDTTGANLSGFTDFGSIVALITSADNLGVGTSSPTNKLSVVGNADISGNLGIGVTTPAFKLDIAGSTNLSSGSTYKINGTDVLSGSALGVGVTASSLTSLGALGNVTVTGVSALNGGITFDSSTDTISAFTAGGTINMANNIITDIGNAGTDFTGAGGLNLAGLLTASSGVSINSETVTDFSGNGIAVTANALGVNLTSSGTTGSTSSNSGLEVGSGGLTLLKGCTDGELLKYTDAGGWACSTDSNTGNVSGFTDFGSIVALTTTADNLGVGTSSPTNKLSVVGTADISGNLGIGTTTPAFKLDVAGSANLSSGSTYKINGTDVISASGLGVGVTASSLTSLGTLGNLTVTGAIVGNGGLTLATGQTFTMNGDAFTDLTGSGIIISGNALTIGLTTSGTTGSTSSNSGLEVGSAGLTLLKGCTDGELLKYTDAGGWACASDIDTDTNSAGFTDFGSIVALTTTADSVGIGTSSPANKLSVVGNADISGNLGVGTTTPGYKLDVVGNVNISSGSTYKINGADVLSGTTLGSGITASSLTSVGTLTNLGVGNSGAFGGGLLVGGETLTDFTGNGVTLSSGALIVNLTSSGTTGSTSSNSGLEVGSAGLTLLKGCTDGELLKYTDAGGWACATDSNSGNISGFTDFGSIVALTTTTDNLGVGTSSPTNKLSVVGTADISGNLGIGTTTPAFKLDVAGSANLSSGSTYKINGTDVLTGSALGVGVTASSLTSVGTLGNLTVTGASALNGGITFDNSTDTISAFTAGGTIDLATNLITNIGNAGTDFVAGGGLTLAGAFTANSTSALNGAVTLGDNAADTVTSTAGVWSFSNATTVDLADSTRGALNFEGGLLALDTLNSRIGIGTTTPTTTLDVVGTGKFFGLLTASSGVSINSETVTDFSGNGIAVTANALGVNLTSSGTTGSTSSNSGLEVGSAGLTLLKGCTDGELLKYTDASGWACAADTDTNTGNISGFTDFGSIVALTTTADSVGIGTSSPANKLSVVGTADVSGNFGIGTTNPGYKLDVVGSANLSSGSTYKINGTDVLSGTTLGSGVTASSLTSVGTLTNLGVGNSGSFGGGLLVGGETVTDFTGNGVTLSSGALTLALTSAGTTGSTSSNSGLEVGSGGLTLLKGCADGEILKYTDASGWACAADVDNDTNTSGFTDFGSIVALTTTADNLGVGTSSPTNKLSVVGTADISGNLGIGTTTPAYKLEVIGTGRLSGLLTASSGISINSETVTDFSGSGIAVTGNALTVNLATSGTTGSTSSSSGLEVGAGGLTLLKGCNDGEILKYTDAGGWACVPDVDNDTNNSGFTDFGSIVALTTTADNVGIGTSSPANKLSVVGNADVSGNFGIGTTAPAYNLEVIGTGRVSGLLTASSGVSINGETVTDLSGSGIALTGNALTVNLTSSGNTGSTSSNSGLEVGSGGLTLLKGCADGEILKYTDGGGWACAADVDNDTNTSGFTDFGAIVALTTTADNLGVGTSSPTNKLSVVGNADISGNLGIGTTTPAYKLDVAGSTNLSSGSTYKINGTDVISASGLGVGVTASSLTSLGTLGNLTVAGTSALNGGITFDSSTDTISAFTAGGTIDLATNLITNIGNAGTDFIAGGGLTLAGAFTANSTSALNGAVTLGDVAADTVTSNAGVWSFTNATTVDLADSSRGALNFEGGLLALDTLNSRIGIGTTTPTQKLDVAGNVNLSSGSTYKINGTDVLSGTTLGSGITASSLTSVGTLTNLGVGNSGSFGGGLLVGGETLTDFTGNGVTLLSGALTVNLTSSGTTGSTSSNSGLEVGSAGLTLLKGCTDGELLKYTDAGGWACAADTDTNTGNVSGFTDFGSIVALTTSADNLGVGTSSPTNKLSVLGTADISGNLGVGTTTPGHKLDVVGNVNLSSGFAYKINGTDVLSGTTLGSGVTASSLTSVGTLTNLTVAGTSALNGGITFDSATDTISAFTLSGTQDAATNLIVNIGDTGTDFIAGGGLTLAGAFTANSTSALNGGVTLGDASSDTVTSNAGVWSFANSTTIDLVNSARNALNIEGGLLSLDTLNSRVGIGSSSSLAGLDVQTTAWLRGASAGASGLYVNGSGNVGIGITMPLNKLDVSGSVAFGSLPANPLPQANSAYFSGNVGIGMTNPTSQLTIQGTSAPLLVMGSTTGTQMRLQAGVGDYTGGVATGPDLRLYRRGSYNPDQFGEIGRVSFSTTTLNANPELLAGYIGVGTNTVGNNNATTYMNLNLLNSGTMSTVLSAQSTGRIGIGTTRPESLLHLRGYEDGLMISAGDTLANDSSVRMALNTQDQLVNNYSAANRILFAAKDINSNAAVGSIMYYGGTGGNNPSLLFSATTQMSRSTSGASMPAGVQLMLAGSGNVGIGSSAPQNKLDVSGSVAFGSLPTNPLPQANSAYFSGSVGIGTTNPAYALEIVGTGRVSGLLTASSGVSINSETVTDFSGNGISVSSNALTVALTSSGTTGSTSSNSGLEVGSAGLTLLKGCTDGEVLKYTDAGGWACAADIDTNSGNISGFTDFGSIVALTTTTDNLGVGTSSPTNKLSVVGTADISGNLGIGTTTPAYKLDVVGSANLSSGSTYKINGTDVLSASGLGVGVTASSLTSLGTLGNVTVAGVSALNGGITFDSSTDTISAFTLSGTQDAATNLIVNIGDAGTDFIAGGGLTLAGAFTANSTAALNGAITLGDNAADTVTANAGVWSFANATTVNLADNARGALNIEAGLLNLDTINTRVGIGTTTPTTTLDVVGTGKFSGLLTASSGVSINSETVTDFSGSGIVVTGNALTVNLTSSGTTGSTSSNSGLEVGSAGLTLLKGCTDGELLKYTDAGGWACAADSNTGNVSGFTDFGSIVALTTSADNLGVGTSSPTNKLSVVGTADISGNLGIGTTTPAFKLDVAGSTNLSSGSTYKINGTDVLSASGLGVGVTASSLTSLGTLGNVSVTGISALNGGITFDQSSDTISSFTLSGTQFAGNNLIVNIGDTGTDFIAGGGLTLAGAFTANSTATLNGAITLGDASSDTITSNAGAWTYANSTDIDLVNSARNALNYEGGLLALDTLNSRVGIGSSSSLAGLDVQTTAWLRGAVAGSSGLFVNGSGNVGIGITMPQNKLDVSGSVAFGSLPTNPLPQANSAYFSGNVGVGTTNPQAKLDVTNNSLSTGTGLLVSSTSTSFSSGKLASIDWSPSSATTATGDVLSVNVGANGVVGNIFNVMDGGSSVFSISQSVITAGLPVNFTAPGDVGIAYDLLFSNQTASNIKSYGPLTIESGESFESNYLTLRTFNSGQLVFDTPGGLLLAQTQRWNLQSSAQALIIADGLMGFDTTNSRVGIGTSNPLAGFDVHNTAWLRGAAGGTSGLYVNGSGSVGIGVTTPQNKLDVNGSVAFGSLPANPLPQANSAYFSGNVGIGTTNPGFALEVNGTARINGGITFGDASSDTVTSTAGVWTLSNGTTIDLVNSARNALNIEGGLLALDTLNSRVGIGSSSSLAGLDVQTTAWLRGASAGASGLYVNGSGNVGIGTTNPLFGLEVNGTARVNGAVTFGDAVGDTVTSTAGAWTFSNASTFDLANSQLNALNIESGLLNIDTSGSTVGIGTTVPTAKLHVLQTGSANSFLVQDVASDTSPFVIDASGRVGIGTTTPSDSISLEVVGDTRLGGNISRNAHGSNNLNDQGSISPNGGFEGLTVSTANLPDDWVDVDTGATTSTTQVNQGEKSLRLSSTNDEVMSTCYPVSGGNTYTVNMSAYVTSSDAVRSKTREYTSLANCIANTSPTSVDAAACTGSGPGQAWSSCNGGQVLQSASRWMRTGIYFHTKSSTHVYVDSVRVVPNSLTYGLDLAETYPAAKVDGIKVGEIVSFGTTAQQVGADVNNVTRSTKAYDNLAFGIVSTKPGIILDDQGATEKVRVALKGRVPVLVSTENGPIKIGDPIVASSKPGVGMKATKAGKILGYAMTELVNSDPTLIDQVIVFVESSWFDPSLTLGSTGDVNGVTSSFASLSPSNTDDIAKDLVKISSDFEKLTLSMNALDSKVDGVKGEVTKLSSEGSSLATRLSSLEEKLKQLEEGGAVLGIGSTNPQLSGESIASASATLDDADSLIDGTESKLSELTVTGLAKLNNLNVIGDATFGMMQIVGIDPAGGSNIDTITGPLRLQATALNDLDIMNGKVLVTTDGNIITKGQITAKKLNISTQDDADDNSVGVAKLLKGTKKVVVKTTAITEKSHVFVTPKSLLDYPLVVTVLEPQTSFTVEVKSSEDKDVEFDWFIVN